jgi:electron transfer flavoprotein alpha subunit
MASLVLAEHNNSSLNEATSKAVTAAAQISTPVHVLVAGADCAKAAEQAAKLQGVETVLCADNARYANLLPEPTSELILSLASAYDAILAPATANGKNILPRVAAKLDVPQISEIITVESPHVFRRPIYAGNAVETVEAKGFKKVITVPEGTRRSRPSRPPPIRSSRAS